MFKNYILDRWTESPINLAVSRVVLSIYLIWKTASVQWSHIYEYSIIRKSPSVTHLQSILPEQVLANAHLIQYVSILVLFVFAIGVFIRATAFLSSFLLCYLGLIRYTVDIGWSTQMFFVASILLMIWALYAEEDVFSADGLYRKTSNSKFDPGVELMNMTSRNYRSTPLTVFLLSIGVLYLGSGIGKLAGGGLEWISPANLGRHIKGGGAGGYVYQYTGFVLENDHILFLAALGTIVLETFFILTILLSRRIIFNLAIIGLIGFHVGIALFMGPVFLYSIVFLMLFLDWEKLVARSTSDSEIELFYDDCNRRDEILLLFKYIDINRTMNFHPQTDSNKYSTEECDSWICISRGDDHFSGDDAIRKLSRHVGVLYPFYAILSLLPISYLGWCLSSVYSDV